MRGVQESNSPCYIKQSFDAGALYIFCNFSRGMRINSLKDVSKSNEAAEAMKITAQDLFKFNIIDEITKEPTEEHIEIRSDALILSSLHY